jgi:predicted ester cyclase
MTSSITSDSTTDLTAQLLRAMTAKDLAAVRRMLRGDFSFTTPEGAAGGGDAFEIFLNRWITAFPDFVQTPDQIVGDASASACSFMFTGVNHGALALVDGGEVPATGKSVAVPAAIFCQWDGEALCRLTFLWDQLAVLSQLELA